MASNLVAPVEDGKIVETESQSSLKKAQSSNNGMDKDAFLQLLVAQMRYQDPLEPTSNTEYIAQYAQFSQVEQMQNLAATSELARATQLVGQEVYIKTTDSTGNMKYVTGKVDYVVFENNKAYLAINESLYSLEDLDTVADAAYLDAYNKALKFSIDMNKLPAVGGVDMTDADAIDKLEETYNGMSDYEKSFLAEETVDKLQKYIERLKQVRAAAEEAEKGTGDGESTEGAGDVEGSQDVESSEGSDPESGKDNNEGAEGAEKGTETTD